MPGTVRALDAAATNLFNAALNLWLKNLAPSTELRQWFDHDPARWVALQDQYTNEVHQHPEAFKQLPGVVRKGLVTLVYSARDEERSSQQAQPVAAPAGNERSQVG